MIGKRQAGIRAAEEHLAEVRRGAQFGARAVEQRGAGQRGERGLLQGFQITGSPQAIASAVFHDQTATGKLNAVITPATPRGCQVSASRCPGRSEGMVRP